MGRGQTRRSKGGARAGNRGGENVEEMNVDSKEGKHGRGNLESFSRPFSSICSTSGFQRPTFLPRSRTSVETIKTNKFA
eukprot:158940-Pleurochrysis_carterae.AAC.1